jgi:hypothetical protein
MYSNFEADAGQRGTVIPGYRSEPGQITAGQAWEMQQQLQRQQDQGVQNKGAQGDESRRNSGRLRSEAEKFQLNGTWSGFNDEFR